MNEAPNSAPTARREPSTLGPGGAGASWRERRERASAEIGHTTVTRPVAWLAAAALGACILAVPIVQLARGGVGGALRSAGGGLAAAAGLVTTEPLAANAVAREALGGLEKRLEEGSPLVDELLPAARWLAVRVLDVGSRDVVTGREEWLFWRADLDAVLTPTGRHTPGSLPADQRPAPDPLPAIRAFRDDLAARDIQLVVVFAPLKTELRGDRLSGRIELGQVVRARGVNRVLEALETEGIAVVDLAAPIGELIRSGSDPGYLRGDSHWRPAAVEAAAGAIAGRIREEWDWGFGMPESPGRERAVERRRVVGHGDLVRLLQLPAGAWESEQVAVRVLAAGSPQLGGSAPVLLLGDSFSNVFSTPELGWGRGAGLGEQLGIELGVPIDVVAVNAGGARHSRERLLAQLGRDPRRLDEVRVVVWELATRELSQGEWPVLRLP